MELINDKRLNEVFEGTNYGVGLDKRDKIKETLTKIYCGYGVGGTSKAICCELGLVNNNIRKPKLTAKGRKYLIEFGFWGDLHDRLLAKG